MIQTRAILLTDVVDSTRLAEELGDARVAEIWVAHDRAVRDLLPCFGGMEVDRTDGFLLLFDRVDAALDFARAFHEEARRIAERHAVPFSARVGVHWGDVFLIHTPAEDRARGAKPLEMEGIAKPTAARVMSLAGGGQTLVTADARGRCEDSAHHFVSHGWWRMKGVGEPVELFEAGGADTDFAPPPDQPKVYRVVREEGGWRPVRDVRCRLPTELDSFVGRASELWQLAQWFDEGARVVTILGLGGVGKTRLALRYARAWLGDHPGGAYFCDLSEARSRDDVVQALAVALDIPLGRDVPEQQLVAAIDGRGRCLLILDTFDHVVRLAGQALANWLNRAPELRVVVTSRERLGLGGERVLDLAPLRAEESLTLFIDRARAASPDLDLGREAHSASATLVRLLDGLPLAIELAAARVRLMPPHMLLVRMTERFRLLAASRGRHARQATLRATLDWSWDLLGPDEKSALAQLAVFDGTFSLDAAEAVLSLDELWPTDAVQALVDKSLVRRTTDGRLDMLSSVHAYASEKLDALGVRADAERRHGRHYAELGSDRAIAALDVHEGGRRRRLLAQEVGNLVVACRRAVARDESAVAVATFRGAAAVHALQGPIQTWASLAESVAGMEHPAPARALVARLLGEALHAVGQGERADTSLGEALVLERAASNAVGEAHVLYALANRARDANRLSDARAAYECALDALRGAPDRVLVGLVRGSLGELLRIQGHLPEALTHLREALSIHRAEGNRRAEAAVLVFCANAALVQSRMEEAASLYEQALAIAREQESRRLVAMVLFNLSLVYGEIGENAQGERLALEALSIHREIGNRRSEGLALGQVGWFEQMRGAYAQATTHVLGAIAIHREIGNRRGEASMLAELGELEQAQGRMEEARGWFEQTLAVAREVRHSRLEGAVFGLLAVSHAARGAAREAREALDEGARLLEAADDRVELAKLYARRGWSEALLGDRQASGWALDEARARASGLGLGPHSSVARTIARCEEAIAARAGR